MFDPEKVERYKAYRNLRGEMIESVRASEFDALLALYRERCAELNRGMGQAESVRNSDPRESGMLQNIR